MTLHELLAPHLEMLARRPDGPLAFRLVMQPAVAIVFAIRAGLGDARTGQSPLLFWQALIYRGGRARKLVRMAWNDINKLFIFACLLDVVYTLVVYGRLYPLQSVIVGATLAIIPYVFLRGRVTWIVSKVRSL